MSAVYILLYVILGVAGLTVVGLLAAYLVALSKAGRKAAEYEGKAAPFLGKAVHWMRLKVDRMAARSGNTWN